MKADRLAQAEVWGRTFEIAVQRGVLAYLLHCNLLTSKHPQLAPWQKFKISDLIQSIYQSIKDKTSLVIQDENIKKWIDAYIRHILVLGYGLGWTAVRECLQHQPTRKMHLEALWCPLTFPDLEDSRETEPYKTARQFHEAFKLSGSVNSSLVFQGEPGRADFLLWLSPTLDTLNRRKPTPDFILCFEFSYNAPLELADFSLETNHCQEISRYARYLESRGSFSRICAEVQGDRLQISSQLQNHLVAFSSQDKPLYKLCQASSYTAKLVALLQNKKRLNRPCVARAMAITANGLESLSAVFGAEPDPRVQLMQSLGAAYQNMRKLDNPEDLTAEIKLVFNKILGSLPTSLRKQAKNHFKAQPDLNQDFEFALTETVKNFFRPADLLEPKTILEAIEDTEALQEFFGTPPRPVIAKQIAEEAIKIESSPAQSQPTPTPISLRDAHKLTIHAGLEAAKAGRLNVIALEGNPGIGKTTSVVSFLKQQSQGFLFLYVSPRVAINRSVTQDLAQDKTQKTGIVTLTTNYKLIQLAQTWYEKQIKSSQKQDKTVDSAVVIDGVTSFQDPQKSTIFITPQQEQEIDDEVVASHWYKKWLNERDEQINQKKHPGVLWTLASSARYFLAENSQINRLVLTAATQGYRNLTKGTTIDTLGKLFKYRVDTRPGLKERESFARHIPQIIVMIDEVAGDSAGPLFVHEIANWLHQEFIEPFQKPLFQVILIVADASLSNELVLDNFLNSGAQVPDKVLISPSQKETQFRVTGTQLKLGKRRYPTLHIMSNSFPATALTIDYSIRLSVVNSEKNSDGKPINIRSAIRSQGESVLLNNAWQEIKKGLDCKSKQIIFFAQDKAFLRKLRHYLIEGDKQLLSAADVAVLDQSVLPSQRLKLVTEPKRDAIRVFLMTSSGARGVSFPKADWIIASFPRFSVEASLMEVAQLIYRGRGRYTDPQTGKLRSGEDIERRLVLLINDFLVPTETVDPQRQWLRISSDLLTLLLMLRSTIFTRITGDAGLRKQPLAFVPVGGVGDTELLRLMSADLQDFLTEVQVFLHDECEPELKKIAAKANELVNSVFKDFDLTGCTPKQKVSSYSNYQTLEGLVKGVSRPSSRLLPCLNPKMEIPPYIRCLGAFWWEDWGDRETQEQYCFQDYQARLRKEKSQLLGLLNCLQNNSAFPSKLRYPACNLYQLLIREKTEDLREYSTLQALKTENLAIALPLDYPQFWHLPTDEDAINRKQELEDPLTWRNALGRALTPHGLVLPAIASYRRFPWAAIAGRSSISQLDRVFDNRYFLASSELNFLNTLLFEED
jgi:hypothetical protein